LQYDDLRRNPDSLEIRVNIATGTIDAATQVCDHLLV